MTLRSKVNVALILALFAFAWTACDNDDDDNASDGKTNLELQLTYTVNGEAYEADAIYDIGGVKTSFNVANFYISNIRVMNEDSEMTMFEDLNLLATPENTTFELGEVDVDHYHMIRFNVGVQPEENSQTETDFTSRPADDPLAMQTPAMHWNWNAGYRFLRVDGLVDADGDGTPSDVLEIHIGTDNFLTEAAIMVHKDAEDVDKNTIELEFDLAKLFTNVDLATESITHTGDKPELALKIKDNIPTTFTKK